MSQSNSTRAFFSNLTYSFSLSGLYGISALYHCPMWSQRIYSLMRRLDHAAIFVLIAGSATPICLLGIKNAAGLHFLSIIWLVAFIGIFISIFWNHGSKAIRAMLYITTGWLAVPFIPEIKASLGTTDLWLLLIGGIVYTIGGLIYAFKWPNPFPRVFGYHEIFHIFVVVASGFHFIVIYGLVR